MMALIVAGSVWKWSDKSPTRMPRKRIALLIAAAFTVITSEPGTIGRADFARCTLSHVEANPAGVLLLL